MSCSIVYTADALQDKQQFIKQGFSLELEQTIALLTSNPTQSDCVELVGDLAGAYSKTIIGNHCIVYQNIPEQDTIKILCIV
jgi:Txe/YoeB family toxin of Txe-Axe toxin-antitoxin module